MSDRQPRAEGRRLTELRRSSAASKFGDRRTKRMRTRAAQKSRAIREQ